MAVASSSLIPSPQRHLENLNAPQREAVIHRDGPILVLAGAGTGKTRVLTRRIAHLILAYGVKPGAILAVTFTNKACAEMRERLSLLLGSVSERLWISTFHSAGLRILRRFADRLGYRNDFVVYDASDSKETIKGILKGRNIDDKRYPVGIFSAFIDQQKNDGVFPENIPNSSKDYAESLKVEVYDLYQRALRGANAMDFGDLLALSYKLLKECPDVLRQYQQFIDYVLVDEFQDTNSVQYELVKMIAGTKRNILVVGDDDQSIYAFRGATVANILNFEKDFPETKIVTLEQNYRSTGNILESANSVIVKNPSRKEKKVWTETKVGDPIILYCGDNESEEARFIAQEIKKRVDGGLTYQDIAIFYRTNAQSRALEEAFLTYRIPYRIFGGLKFYDRKEIKDIVSYLRLISNPFDNQAFLRVINTPTRGIGASAIQGLQDVAHANGCSLYEAAKGGAGKNKNIKNFVALIEGFKNSYKQTRLSDLISDLVERTEYGPRLRILKEDPTAQSRLENIQELIGIAVTLELAADADPNQQFLEQFLDRVALASADETPSQSQNGKVNNDRGTVDAVSCMTLHLAKGLEFDIVFFTGFEEGLVPHFKCVQNPDEIEEERRLCYVGITRARHQLFITRSRQRGMFSSGGDTSARFREPSRFAFDLPKGAIKDINDGFFSSYKFDVEESVYEYEDEPLSPWGKRRSGKSRGWTVEQLFNSQIIEAKKTHTAFSGLTSADSLERLNNLEPVKAQDLAEGLKVAHPSFGNGIITRIDGERKEDDASCKVSVKFEAFEREKKLVFRFAGLRKVPDDSSGTGA